VVKGEVVSGVWQTYICALVVVLAATGCAGVDGEDARTGGHQTAPGANVPQVRPEQLLGLDREGLAGLLGTADFKRNDGPAEIWQFRETECVLDVFLYAEPTDGGYRVEHVEARDRSLVRAAEETCVTGLLKARRTRAAAGATG
jgi:hypothetical protein